MKGTVRTASNPRDKQEHHSWLSSSEAHPPLQSSAPSPPPFTTFQGRALIPPSSPFARAVMGNEASLEAGRSNDRGLDGHYSRTSQEHPHQRPASNLTVLMNQHNSRQEQLESPNGPHESGHPASRSSPSRGHHLEHSSSLDRKSHSNDEADSASGPPPDQAQDSRSANVRFLGSSAPSHLTSERRAVSAYGPFARERSTVAPTASAVTAPNPSYAFLVSGGSNSKSSTSLSRTKHSSEDPASGHQPPSRSNSRVRRFVVLHDLLQDEMP
jgi:hypothetical protein